MENRRRLCVHSVVDILSFTRAIFYIFRRPFLFIIIFLFVCCAARPFNDCTRNIAFIFVYIRVCMCFIVQNYVRFLLLAAACNKRGLMTWPVHVVLFRLSEISINAPQFVCFRIPFHTFASSTKAHRLKSSFGKLPRSNSCLLCKCQFVRVRVTQSIRYEWNSFVVNLIERFNLCDCFNYCIGYDFYFFRSSIIFRVISTRIIETD